ncbi:MAG: hypothetical protein COA99_13745 [Moraxellaceae bacterium]|nr:MAG: hypothetical protein COA99_13745 [Moraxellaceae bacterium]
MKVGQLILLITLLLTSKEVLTADLIADKTASQLNMEPYISYYFDTSKNLEIADIKNTNNTLTWISPADKHLDFSISDAAVWIKATLNNSSDTPITRVIELPYSLIDSVEFYHINPGGRLLSNYIMGSELPFYSRPIPHHNFVIPVTLAANSSSEIFLRLMGSHSLQAYIQLWTNEAFWERSQRENQRNFVYFSLVLALMAYALYRSSAQPRIRRVIFPGMVITPLLALLTIEGYAFQYVWPEHPFWNKVGLATLIPGSLTFLSLYTYIIFSKMAAGDRWHHSLLSLSVINIFLLLAPIVINYDTALTIGLIAALMYLALLGYLSIKHWAKLSHPNRVTILGFSWLSISTLIFILEITSIIPSFPLIEAPLQVGFFLFIFSLFWAQLSIYTRARSLSKKKAATLEDVTLPTQVDTNACQ